MSRRDFEQCTPSEFYEAFNQWATRHRNQERAEWERTRTVAMFMIQPYVKGHPSAHDVLPLPWDNETTDKEERPELTKEEMNERFEEAKKKFKMK